MSSRSPRSRPLAALAAFVVLAVTTAMMTLSAGPAGADGTETLGPPSIPISDGTGFVMDGTGMVSQPGTIDINVPAGATVEQVIAYWEGQHSTAAAGADNTITLDGQPVVGTLIGGPTKFFTTAAGGHWSSTYRADVTALNLITGPGLTSVDAADMSFDRINNGAGLLVIIDDGGTKSELGLRDGNDLAYFDFAPPLDTTVAQTFTFAASPDPRTADLGLFASSVEGQEFPGDRPNIIEVTVDGVTTQFGNLLMSNDGHEWDTVNLQISIPAGATSLTVQILSEDPANPDTGKRPASLAWNAAALSVPGVPPPDAAINIEKYVKVIPKPFTGNLCVKFGNKPKALVLEYVGGNVQSHAQKTGNVIIQGNPGNTSPVRIQVSTKKTGGTIYFNQVVNLGDEFTLDTSSFPPGTGPGTQGRLPTNVFMRIFVPGPGGAQLQYVQFHTSCSQPLRLGDRFGSVVLTGYTGQNGSASLPDASDPNDIGVDADSPPGPSAKVGDTVVWTYLVTNPETVPLQNVAVKDDNGTPANLADDFSPAPVLSGGFNVGDTNQDGILDPGEEWRYTASALAKSGQYANTGTATANRVDTNAQVSDSDLAHYKGTL